MGIDNGRCDAVAMLLFDLGFPGVSEERQVEAGEQRVGVLSQVLLDISTIHDSSQHWRCALFCRLSVNRTDIAGLGSTTQS